MANTHKELICLNRDDIVRLLPMRECMDIMAETLRALARGEGILPLRSFLTRPDGRAMLMMPAALGASGPFGLKLITMTPQNQGTGHEMIQGVVFLFDAEHGALNLIADAMTITAIRTAAVSGVATQLLAKPDAGDLAIIGTGTEAKSHLECMLVARPIRRIRVWGRNAENARLFAAWAKEQLNAQIEVCASAKEAVANADIICTVTSSPEPLVQGAWISRGAHINAVGAYSRSTRELDSNAVVDSRFFVDRRESALSEAGEFCIPQQEGKITESHIQGELGEVLTGKIPGRRSETEITLFKSLGIAVEDLAAAVHLFEKATQSGTGTRISF